MRDCKHDKKVNQTWTNYSYIKRCLECDKIIEKTEYRFKETTNANSK